MDKVDSLDLLNNIHKVYGYDILNYDLSFVTRILKKFATYNNIEDMSYLKEVLLSDETLTHEFINMLFINVSTMFRDPDVFNCIAKDVLPYISSYPAIKIWSAGCAYGEEIYSIAILLKELGLYDRAVLYATDIDEEAIKKAKLGKFTLKQALDFCQNYYLAGRKDIFQKYFDIKDDFVYIKESIKKNIYFSTHNLITDGVFNTFSLILCRNLFIYFDNKLQEKALKTFSNSLEHNAFLVLGQSESIRYNNGERYFKEFSIDKRIYKNKKGEF
jgi:chemotaxis protein methyltransferase CheR